jgi:hypothetical protein
MNKKQLTVIVILIMLVAYIVPEMVINMSTRANELQQANPILYSTTLDQDMKQVHASYFGRIIDVEADVVCWIAFTGSYVGSYTGAGLSCLPINETFLRLRRNLP